MNPMLMALMAGQGGGGAAVSPFGIGTGAPPGASGGAAPAAASGSGFGSAIGGLSLGILGDALGGYLGNKSAKKARARREQYGSAILNSLAALQQQRGLQSEGKLNEALEALAKGTAGQLRQSDQIGRGAKRRVLDREQQNQGQVTQSLTNAGLSNTTRTANLSRAVKSDTDRALLDIDDALARIKTGIIGQGAAQQAGGLTDIANLYQQRSAQSAAIENTRYNLFTGGQIAPPAMTSMAGLGPLAAGLFGGQQGLNAYKNLFAGGN